MSEAAAPPTPSPPSPPPREGPPSPPPPAALPWGLRGAVAMLATFFGIQLACGLLFLAMAAAVIVTLQPGMLRQPAQLVEMSQRVAILPTAIVYAIAVIVLIHFLVTVRFRMTFREALRLGRPRGGPLVACVLLGGVMAFFLLGVTALFPPVSPDDVGGPLYDLARSGPLGHALWFLMAVTVAPAVEEIVFRGFVYRGARERLGPLGAGLLVTIPFVLAHTAETRGYLPALAALTTFAILLVILIERTGNLWYCIACHFGYNASLASLSLIVWE